MRTRFLLCGLAAIAALAACSKAETNVPETVKDGGYVGVKFVMGNTAATKAATEGDYVYGTDDENKIDNATFLFFTATGAFSCAADVSSSDLTLVTTNGDGNNVAKEYTATITLQYEEAPVEFVVLANQKLYKAATFKNNQTSKTMALAAMGDATSESFQYNGVGMSSSSYSEDGKTAIYTVAISASDIKTSKEAAAASPVDVYLDRGAAKVTASKGSSFKVNSTTVDDAGDGTTYTITPEMQAYNVTRLMVQAYGFKNLATLLGVDWTTLYNADKTALWTSSAAGKWYNAADHRSFWAKSPDFVTGTSDGGLDSYRTWEELTAQGVADNLSEYINENTTNTYSCLIATAILKDASGNVVELTKYHGLYYTLANFVKLVITDSYAKGASFKKGDTALTEAEALAEYESAGEDFIYLNHNGIYCEHRYQACPYLGDGYTYVPEEGGADTDLMSGYVAHYWRDGKCYYYANIEHFGPIGYNIGVVRNHVYALTVNSVTGLGVPVPNPGGDDDPDPDPDPEDEPDPDDPIPGDPDIDPEDPTDETYYLGATIKVLEWKQVNQTVDLK